MIRIINFSLDYKNFSLKTDSFIETIMIFGSYSRNEQDIDSDIDFLIILNDCSYDDCLLKKTQYATELGIPPDWISIYRKSTILKMNEYSSYFLWHLKLEGILIYSKNNFIDDLFLNLTPYKKVLSDLNQYLTICNDIEKALAFGTENYKFELNLLASLARNTCITLCYIIDDISFGRIEPIRKSISFYKTNFPFNLEEYIELYSYRISYNRQNSTLDFYGNVKLYIIDWIFKIRNLINLVKTTYNSEDLNEH